ncbi:hypothetical protein MOQ67_12595 [Pseudomonas sp. LY-1]|jgi:hypothetical protein|uniref:Uncharacterized protein n=1 Tax=Pseudomonas veronii TaxID=76761 RepID=A0A7Y1A3H2_PSEVE|nr:MULTISPECIES: hypothetical protein [Pseudomonas]MBI6557210.1 hypothetical protein [Pseudomonas veronii]MBI6651910.1 hypothetical protein [Pseudomonas veronii]MBJ2181230.1 hypothetical protein [Pseudomonas veronii]MDF3242853.1 hypothetical protein [Pseudomonas veronii]NMY08488.1 hypothetical protein [Pseudomonas veronii]
MKQLLIWTLFGMIVSTPLAVQASDGADALVRWHQQFKQEQKKLTERQAGGHGAGSKAAVSGNGRT